MTVRFTRPIFALFAVVAMALIVSRPAVTSERRAPAAKPLKALLVTGGCCHDYTNQKKILSEAISKRANVEWTLVQEGGSSTNHKVSLYSKADWAAGYDVVVHNECFADVNDMVYIKNFLDAHKNGVPAIVVHCAMHTFRDIKTDDYREFLGVTTRSHGRQHPLEVKNVMAEDPIMKGFPAVWTTGNEELYAILKVWPTTTPLATAQNIDNKENYAIIWKNTYGKGRVFGTTLAHNNKTMSDPVFLDMFTRGLLWSVDKLEADGKPAAGFAASPEKAE